MTVGDIRSNQIKSNLKNFYSAPYNNGRERLTKYIGLIIKCEVKYNIGVSQEYRAIGNIKQKCLEVFLKCNSCRDVADVSW